MTNIFDEHLPPISPSLDKGEPEEVGRSKKRREIESISSIDLRSGKIELATLASLAFETLEKAMKYADYPTAVVAAKMVLDRSGFGPSSTLKIDESLDLSDLSRDELCDFAFRIASALRPSTSRSGDDGFPCSATVSSVGPDHAVPSISPSATTLSGVDDGLSSLTRKVH